MASGGTGSSPGLVAGSGVRTASFSLDGRRLMTAGDDGTLVLWRVADGVRQRTIQAHGEAVNSVAWHPDGNHVISASRDRTLRLWTIQGQLQATLESGSGSTGSVNWVSFSPEGDWIASVPIIGYVCGTGRVSYCKS